MFCTNCNLEYPDHLNFCRRCGQTLVRALGERATESVCCTRCGARVVHGEKFCQNCGTRASNVGQETVIGMCQNCHTYWRSGWQYCKSCGVASEQALQPNPASTHQQNVAKKNTLESAISEAQVLCPDCEALTQPFSLFCDHCGMRLNKEELPARDVTNLQEVENTSHSQVTGIAEMIHENRGEDDSLSRLDDLLLDDPLENKVTNNKKTALGKTASWSGSLTIDATPSATTEPNRLTSSPLRLIGKRRETEPVSAFDQAGSLPNNGTSPGTNLQSNAFVVKVETNTPGSSPRLWRDAVISREKESDLASSPTTESYFTLASKSSTQPASLFVGDLNLSRRPGWQIPLLLGGVLLGSFLLVGIWRKAPSVPSNSSASTSKPVEASSTSSALTIPAGMVFIPGGKFEMGRNDGLPVERPLRTLELKPFFLDRTEVTNQQYMAFVEATGRVAPDHWRGGKPPSGESNLPVVNVTWEDARDFAAWVSKRLPTEEEWEFAARSTDGRLYPWGNTWEPSFANTREGKMDKIVEVGRNLAGASPYGVVDMCGNVWEWTSSQFRAYGTQELLEDGVMVIRGGAFDSPKDYATTTYRGAVKIGKPYPKTGFRCAKDLP